MDSIILSHIAALCSDVRERYSIGPEAFADHNVKRGLRNADGTGVLVGATRIGSVQGYYMQDGERVPMPGKLYYRGIRVTDLVENHWAEGTFGYEEVAYLLLLGKLPNREESSIFNTMLAEARPLPNGFFEDIILKAPSPSIMNELARSVLALYSYDDNPEDRSVENLMRQSIGLIARFPGIVADAYHVKRHAYDGKSLYIHNPRDGLSVSENFLRMVREDKSYTAEEAKLLDLMFILHAEHGGGNNSAFVCRSMTSTGTDTYSAVAGAVGSLKGPLHGGASGKVVEMFRYIRQNVRDYGSDAEIRAYLEKLFDGTEGDHSGKLYGLGHAVYTESDPRALMIKKYAKGMAAEKGMLEEFALMENVERLGIELIEERKKRGFPICANVDFYSGFVYGMLGIPEELYTPLFAIARIAGWCAHRIEEVVTCDRIMRPAYRAIMTKEDYIPMDERL
jgi:citrate synthase